jgi:hypothetical protein
MGPQGADGKPQMNRRERRQAGKAGKGNRETAFAAGCHFMALGELASAEAMFRRALALRRDFAANHNLGEVLRRGGRAAEALPYLRAALALAPDDHRVHNSLVGTYLDLFDYERAKAHGERALELKDREASEVYASLAAALPAPNAAAGRRDRKIISFSLWGANPLYRAGALANVAAAAEHFPGWVCRFYCGEDLPAGIVAQLRAAGAEAITRPLSADFYAGLLWRFEVADDPEVSVFLCRDCDSRPCRKEAMAVAAWLDSGADFHVMRDNVLQCEVMLAGLWGGRAGRLPPMAALAQVWRERCFEALNAAVQDQMMLRHLVWPLIRDRCLAHDSVYRFHGARPFPTVGTAWDGQQLGSRV